MTNRRPGGNRPRRRDDSFIPDLESRPRAALLLLPSHAGSGLAKRNPDDRDAAVRCVHESATSVSGEIWMAVMAGELIYANVRLRLMTNRT